MWMAISAGVRDVGVGRNVSETSGRFLISLMTPERVYCQASRASSRAVLKAMKEEFYAFSLRPRKDRRSPRHRDRYILIARQRAVVGARAKHIRPPLRKCGGDDVLALGRDGGGLPEGRPGRVGASPRVLPGLDLSRGKRYG